MKIHVLFDSIDGKTRTQHHAGHCAGQRATPAATGARRGWDVVRRWTVVRGRRSGARAAQDAHVVADDWGPAAFAAGLGGWEGKRSGLMMKQPEAKCQGSPGTNGQNGDTTSDSAAGLKNDSGVDDGHGAPGTQQDLTGADHSMLAYSSGTVCCCPVDQDAWEVSVVRQDPLYLQPNRYRGPRGPSRLSWGSMRDNMATSSTDMMNADLVWGRAGEPTQWKLDSCEGSALRWMAAQPAEQKLWVSHLQRQETARSCMNEVLALRSSAKLSRRGEGIEIGLDNVATQTASVQGGRCAASAVEMRSGTHRAIFTVKHGTGLLFGVIRPSWNVETGKNPHCSDLFGPDPHACDDHCFFLTSTGQRYPGCQDWPGMQPATVADTVTMELDLGVGTMTLWMNDQLLGVMKSGLTGPYCWAVSFGARGVSAAIKNAPPPPLPSLQLERSSWGTAADLLSAGLSAQYGVSSSQQSFDRDYVDDEEDRPPPPGCADISDRMVEQMFQEKQKHLRRQRRRQTARSKSAYQQQHKQQQQHARQGAYHLQQQRLLQVTARGWPSMGITPQQARDTDAIARELLRPGW
eukprot:COSAG02_NODE_46_length_45443_cov_36.731497_18_plen_576_part_00